MQIPSNFTAVLTALFIVGLPILGLATEVPSAKIGKALFESTALSTQGKSCSSCHHGGKGLEEIEAYDDGMLREMINFCIRDALKGEMLPEGAQELESIRLYLRSFRH